MMMLTWQFSVFEGGEDARPPGIGLSGKDNLLMETAVIELLQAGHGIHDREREPEISLA